MLWSLLVKKTFKKPFALAISLPACLFLKHPRAQTSIDARQKSLMICHDEIVDYKATFDAGGKLDKETLDYLDCQADMFFYPDL